MTVTQDRQGLQVLGFEECLTLVASKPVGRVAFMSRGEIVVLPVNHCVDEGGIAFRTATGSMFDAAIMQGQMTFEVDDYDEATRTGWSVVVRAVGDYVDDDDRVAALEKHDLHPWSSPELRSRWVLLRPTQVSGRRILGNQRTP